VRRFQFGAGGESFLKIVVNEFCGTMKKAMIRRWVQLLALMTMAVSVVNAQCAMSCSLLSMMAPAPGHSCCHHGSPSRQAPGTPCDRTVVHADAARLEFSGAAVWVVVPVAATAATFREFLPPPTSRPYADRFPAPDSSGPGFRSVSVLRI
jgi:hypothetical protein